MPRVSGLPGMLRLRGKHRAVSPCSRSGLGETSCLAGQLIGAAVQANRLQDALFPPLTLGRDIGVSLRAPVDGDAGAAGVGAKRV